LIEPIINKPLRLITDESLNVDIEISSVYGNPGPTDLLSKLTRLMHSKTPGGVPFGSWAKGFNLQPNKKARVNIFYTGENERPPFGDWDAYLSFDLHSYQGKNAYLPLWWITCTDIAGPNTAPYLNEPVSVTTLLSRRGVDFQKRRKFCVAFIGKAYPFRMQALNQISEIENVEVTCVTSSNVIGADFSQLYPVGITYFYGGLRIIAVLEYDPFYIYVVDTNRFRNSNI
jgi:hypothetical protein